MAFYTASSNACNLPTIQVPEAKIFRTEQLAKRYKQAGIGTGIVGGILLFWRSRFAATITGIFGVLTVAYGRLLWNKGERMSQESIAFRGLNAMLAQAQACHDQGKMHEFFDVLSSSYATNKKLLSLEEIGESSGEKKIIDLLASGIRPDDVASLFLLIGIALRSGKVSILRCSLRHLITRAQHSFEAILRPELVQAIQDLDKRMAEIEEQRNKRSPWEQYVETWKNFLLLRDEDDASLLASVHPVEDAQGMSVQQRLAAISKIAQMEVTSIEMEVTSVEMDTGLSEKNTLADQLCKEAREGIEDYLQLQLYPMPELSSAATKDSLKVISGHVAAIEVLEL